ncbi:hypothetical protein GCM10028820_01870 [Tessaracoccus terricola]
MGRILITSASRVGATTDVAAILADALTEAGHDVVATPVADSPTPDGFDLVVVGSGIHATAWYADALGWLERHGGRLDGRTALFNVCLNAADPTKRDEALGYNRSAASLVEPVAQASFAGRYVPERVSWWKRVFMRTMQARPKDHVDPDAIRAWAAELGLRAPV